MVTLRMVDLLAGSAWLVAVLLAAADTITPGPPGELAVWALLASAVAATLSAVAWLTRRLDGYREGVDYGLRSAGIVRLPDRDRDRV